MTPLPQADWKNLVVRLLGLVSGSAGWTGKGKCKTEEAKGGIPPNTPEGNGALPHSRLGVPKGSLGLSGRAKTGTNAMEGPTLDWENSDKFGAICDKLATPCSAICLCKASISGPNKPYIDLLVGNSLSICVLGEPYAGLSFSSITSSESATMGKSPVPTSPGTTSPKFPLKSKGGGDDWASGLGTAAARAKRVAGETCLLSGNPLTALWNPSQFHSQTGYGNS